MTRAGHSHGLNSGLKGLHDILKGFALVILLAAVIITQTGCGSETAEPVTGENYLLDTVCTISIYGMKDENGEVQPASALQEEADAAIDEAFALCASLDKKLSRTAEASEISRINNAGGEWTDVSADTLRLLKEGIRYSELSGGEFDITIGGVTDLWDFHADPEDARVPEADAIAEAVRHVDYRNIEIRETAEDTAGSGKTDEKVGSGNIAAQDGAAGQVRLTDPDARIDLGGIAKGYIGDRMAESLEAAGVTSGIVNLGGNVICIGGKTSDEDFTIGVEAPFSDRSEIVGKIRARDMTLVTSGVYERKIEVDGKLYHHILSTETGYSAETDLDAVTLTASKGHSMDIDALSTICLIKGCEDAKKLIEETDGVEAVFILNDGSIEQTSGMEFEKD